MAQEMQYQPESSHPTPDTRPVIQGSRAAVELVKQYGNAKQEHLIVIDLNDDERPIETRVVSTGTRTRVEAEAPEIFRGAISNNAAAVVVFHNHPSGEPQPSNPDLTTTRNLLRAGVILQIPVMDHIILGRDGSFHSIRESHPWFWSTAEAKVIIEDRSAKDGGLNVLGGKV